MYCPMMYAAKTLIVQSTLPVFDIVSFAFKASTEEEIRDKWAAAIACSYSSPYLNKSQCTYVTSSHVDAGQPLSLAIPNLNQ